MKENTDISERISQMLDYLDVTRNVFAKSLGYNRSQSIYDIINGKSKPSFDFFNRLFSSEFSEKINPNWLITGKGEMLITDPKSITTSPQEKSKNNGVPYYDIDITASFQESFNDIAETPEMYIDFKPFNDCTAYLPIYGDSMYPKFASGEIVALKKITNLNVILFGEPYLIITNNITDNLRTLKIIRKHKDEDKLILKPSNPNFDETVIPKESVVSLYLVKGKITRKQL